MKGLNLYTHAETNEVVARESQRNENQPHYDEFVEMALWFTKEIQREHIGLPTIALKKQ